MRSHRSMKPQPKAAERREEPEEVVVLRRKVDAMSQQIEALEGAVRAAAASGSQVDPQSLQPIVDAMRSAAERPKMVALRVVRGGDGKISGMLATSDPREIERIVAMGQQPGRMM